MKLRLLVFYISCNVAFEGWHQGIKGDEIPYVKKLEKLNCSTKFSREIIQLIIDYASWRSISMLYLLDDSINAGCNMKMLSLTLECFNENSLRIALLKKPPNQCHLTSNIQKTLIVSFVPVEINLDYYNKQLSLLNNENFAWFHIHLNSNNISDYLLTTKLSNSAISLSSDLVLAIGTEKLQINHLVSIDNCKRPRYHPVKQMDFPEKKLFLSYNGNITFPQLCGTHNNSLGNSLCMLQLYKIRASSNSTMIIRPLGYWNYETGTVKLKRYQSVEFRMHFYGTAMVFGRKQKPQDVDDTKEIDGIIPEADVDVQNLDGIAEYIVSYLNATKEEKNYPNLGLKTSNGNWSGLLGAVVTQEVDIGLDMSIKSSDFHHDMTFTHNIMVTDRNIYLKPEQSNNARNIFMAPFDPELLMCVLIAGLIFALVMAIYIVTDMKRHKLHSQTYLTHIFALFDSIFWIVGVFSMQGTQIQPRKFSGNIIVVVSLMFALIIYNSYSAFITSMLSFKLPSIRTVSDLLKSTYELGYTKNSQDEELLRTMNDTQLTQIYLRGFLHIQTNPIKNITDGLLRATRGNYGFFATGHLARKEFLRISGYKCKFDITEILAPYTRHMVAFPVSKKSPYRKVINLCLIKMKETGVHDYVKSQIAPNLPKCDQQSSYQSARINDIATALQLFLLGVLLGLFICLMECSWKNRNPILAKLRKLAIHPNCMDSKECERKWLGRVRFQDVELFRWFAAFSNSQMVPKKEGQRMKSGLARELSKEEFGLNGKCRSNWQLDPTVTLRNNTI
ncbi:hypothetical protein ABEB36_011700 [Hypothenemus hampei]|uniref:Ionotropic glutamate receptor C-terminal domain-containing protein n=1 Tax=Hypothenemus hampei TaxID=57062 RepID=A0ABD1EBF1_HYPHA